jgi:hypothetical protein
MKYIKLFENFINENVNGILPQQYDKITYKQAEAYLERLHNNNEINAIIFRGMSYNIGKHAEYMLFDPTKFKNDRVSSETHSKRDVNYNLLNLIMSNDSRFNKFENRSKSLICSTDWTIAEEYEHVYIVIPLNLNFTFSYIPYDDIYRICHPVITYDELLKPLILKYDININGTSYTDTMQAITEFDKKCLDNIFNDEFNLTIKDILNKYIPRNKIELTKIEKTLNYIKNNNINLSEYINYIYNIDKFLSDIKNINYKDISTIKNSDKKSEIWTTKCCLLISSYSDLAKHYFSHFDIDDSEKVPNFTDNSKEDFETKTMDSALYPIKKINDLFLGKTTFQNKVITKDMIDVIFNNRTDFEIFNILLVICTYIIQKQFISYADSGKAIVTHLSEDDCKNVLDIIPLKYFLGISKKIPNTCIIDDKMFDDPEIVDYNNNKSNIYNIIDILINNNDDEESEDLDRNNLNRIKTLFDRILEKIPTDEYDDITNKLQDKLEN